MSKESKTYKNSQKKVYICTFGCQMNEYDSEIVKSILIRSGFIFTEDINCADIIMLNTCSVRDNAHRKVFGHIHRIKHKLKGKDVKIGILGCMASAMKEDLLNDTALNLNFIVGPDSYKELPHIIEESFNIDRGRGDIPSSGTVPKNPKPHSFDLSEFETYSDINPTREEGVNAWIAIMRGCNNFCSFCIVPYTRGRERSRSPESIIEETKRLVANGYKQVTLLGQNVNSYFFQEDDAYSDTGSKQIHFANLIEQVSKVEGIERVRFTSPHPKDFPEDLIKIIASNKKICKHIHLPLQSGNNRILKLMNRTYTKNQFLSLVKKIKTAIPNIALTTDIIVGFPTETDEEFNDTLDVMKKVRFDSAFIFKYSPRKGTTAFRNYKDNVAESKKTERIVFLNNIQKEISMERNSLHIGKEEKILIEETNNISNTARGRNDNNILTEIDLSNSNLTVNTGDIVNVKIISATPHILIGDILINNSSL